LYRAVLPITKSSSGKYRLGQKGDQAFEYALQMQEFPQSSLFRAMFEAKTLKLQHLQDLGHRLACWHLDASTDSVIRAFGSVEATQAVAEDNFRATEQYIGSVQTPENSLNKHVTFNLISLLNKLNVSEIDNQGTGSGNVMETCI
jgi:hypothetical protein|tara:strand:- start:698 stop:1132 length:435 start_codon:yes stop_codon:yes gene_type:complete